MKKNALKTKWKSLNGVSKMLKVIELFSGIGTQREALKRADIPCEIVATSEIDKYASQAYELLHGKTNNMGDITKIERLPKADLWTYSFPCTDISIAGKLGGFAPGTNTHSSLLWEVQRLLKTAQENNELPHYLIMENVRNILSDRFKPLFNVWLEWLTSLGYKNYYQLLNAKDYGIPQNRIRCYMVYTLDDKPYEFPKPIPLTTKLSDYLEKDVEERYFLSKRMIDCLTDMREQKGGFVRGLLFKPHYTTANDYAFAITTKAGYRSTDNYIIVPQKTKDGYALAQVDDGVYTDRDEYKRGVVQKSMIPTLKTSSNDIGVVENDKDNLISVRRLTPRECWRLMGWTDDRIDLVVNKFSNTQLYKMAGNAIVVDVLERIFKNIWKKD